MADEEEKEPTLNELWANTTEEHDPQVRTESLVELARRLRSVGEFWRSIGAAQTALDIFAERGDQAQVGHSHMHIGRCYIQLEEYNDALDSFAKAGECFQEIADDTHRGDALRALGDAYEALEKPDEAALVRRDAISLLVSAQAYTRAGIAALDLGESQGRAGRQSEALATFEEAYKYFQEVEDITGTIRAHDRIAAAQIDLGRVDEALEHLWEAMMLAHYVDDQDRYRWGQYRLGWTLVIAGDYELAIQLLKSAVKSFKKVGQFGLAALADLQRAHAMNALGKSDRATHIYRQVRAVFNSLGNDHDALLASVNVAENQARSGNHLDARETYAKCLAEAVKIEDEWLERAIRVRAAETELVLGGTDLAVELLEATEPDAWGEDLSEKARHYNVYARALIAADRQDEARSKLEKVIELNLTQSLPAEAAAAYEMMALNLSDVSEDESKQLLAQAIALYLASGLVDRARELSKGFIPSDNSQAVQMLRREFKHGTSEEPATAEPQHE